MTGSTDEQADCVSAFVLDTRSTLHSVSGNAGNPWLLILTSISTELTLGGSGAAVESDTAPVTVPHTEWGPESSQPASYCLTGSFPAQHPVPFLEFLSTFHAFAVLCYMDNFQTRNMSSVLVIWLRCFPVPALCPLSATLGQTLR